MSDSDEALVESRLRAMRKVGLNLDAYERPDGARWPVPKGGSGDLPDIERVRAHHIATHHYRADIHESCCAWGCLLPILDELAALRVTAGRAAGYRDALNAFLANDCGNGESCPYWVHKQARAALATPDAAERTTDE